MPSIYIQESTSLKITCVFVTQNSASSSFNSIAIDVGNFEKCINQNDFLVKNSAS